MDNLPITPYLDEICKYLENSPTKSLVLTAPTASGKSTVVPIALLKHFTGKIIMLEPRRIAAIAVTSRIAELLGENVGESAGYIMRMERHTSKKTRLTVMTEGVFTRILQDDPMLEGIDVVVLDEAHERSINTDEALAFLKETMGVRGDLYVIVMSATMDTANLAAYLGNGASPAPVIAIPDRRYSVETVYMGDNGSPLVGECKAHRTISIGGGVGIRQTANAIADMAVAAINTEVKRLKNGEAMLVFLPGIKEIKQVQDTLLLSEIQKKDIEVMLLHSSIPLDEQRLVLSSPSPLSPPRIILASAIAETSLTVPCVKIVIDSGLSRVNRMNVASGMSALTTETESTFSAEQRRGRAGRTGSGRCVRLWTESNKRLDKTDPEILRGDIIPLVLECSAWCGVCDMDKLQWLSPPSANAWNAAKGVLEMMGLIEGNRVTSLGKAAIKLGVHPRIACVALAGAINGDERGLEAAVSCAIDYSDYANASVKLRHRAEVDLLKKVKEQHITADTLPYYTAASSLYSAFPSRALLLLAGFPDRLGRLEGDGVSYRFPSGRVAELNFCRYGRGYIGQDSSEALYKNGHGDKSNLYKGSVLPKWIVAPVVDAGERTGRVYDWKELDDDVAAAWLTQRVKERSDTVFENGTYKLKKTIYTHYGKIDISSRNAPVSREDYAAAVCAAVKEKGLDWLPLGEAARKFLSRARFYAANINRNGLHVDNKYDIDALKSNADKWLTPFITGGVLTETIVLDALRYFMNGQEIDRLVPRRITLSNGTACRVEYETIGNVIRPTVEVVIQKVYKVKETPLIMGVPITFRLLSPARRPVQVTDDLNGFWHGTWREVAKEMRARYPKHDWSYIPE